MEDSKIFKGEPATLTQWANKILYTEDPVDKVELTKQAGKWWRSSNDLPVGHAEVPDIPPRPTNFEIVAPGKAPKRGKAGSLASRINILHALANVEQWAIDTAWDNIARFGSQKEGETVPPFPKEYYDDFVKMALDEAKHFGWLIERMSALGAKFGDVPIHAGIWESAHETKDMMPARMAIVHMVHEARGLDVNPATIKNFTKHGDIESGELLERIYQDEITHVEIGTRWFKYYCTENEDLMEEFLTKEAEKEALEDAKDPSKASEIKEAPEIELPEDMLCKEMNNLKVIDPTAKYFHALVSKHFFGRLKPPFNYPARDQAGLTREFYEPLSLKPSPFDPNSA